MATQYPMKWEPEPDLHPIYPTVSQIRHLLTSDSGLDPLQKSELANHCLRRACLFADLSILQFLITDPLAQVYIDLKAQDEDGAGLVSLTIHGFGGDLDRDVEREECVRYLVSQGADLSPDKAGWTPLHHAALIAPPTLVSYLMTHGCSPFELTGRNLTPLDIVTAHSLMPGKEDVALLLEEAMRGDGWTGGQLEQKRRLHERREKRKGKRKAIRDEVCNMLGVHPKWWDPEDADSGQDSDEEGEDSREDNLYTPFPDYTSMLVFSPTTLPQILDSAITSYPITLNDPTPAQTLYFLVRFACLTCDHIWLEDLVMAATDAIEDAFFNNADDLPTLLFWLHNTTLWLHLMQCDKSIRPALEMLGSFEIVEEVINSVFVFVIRFAERRIDQLLDSTVLDFAPSGSESETVQFESEWSFLRTFAKKKVPPPIGMGSPRNPKHAPSSSSSSIKTFNSLPSTAKFSSLKRTLARAEAGSRGQPLSSIFAESPVPSPEELTSFFTAFHALLAFANINPIFITQLWSQVFYWTSCELFNRIITRKKYLCRSRALQINVNLAVIEEWVDELGLPPGILLHLAPVLDLLNWLQGLSSVAEFPELVAVIQSMRHLNPLQMRRAVRDYKYEVDESKMNDECIQYIIQLQKDWERHRVKLGVEILRKEISERERERDDSASTLVGDDHSSILSNTSVDSSQRNVIDVLLDRNHDRSWWQPVRAPQALGELLDSRYMLPLLFPDDPHLLSALPSKAFLGDPTGPSQPSSAAFSPPGSAKSSMDFGRPNPLLWRSRDRKLRETGIRVLEIVDGARSISQWWKNYNLPHELEDHDHDDTETEHENDHQLEGDDQAGEGQLGSGADVGQRTPFTRKPSGRSTKGRPSLGDVTPIDGSFGFRPSNPLS